MSNQESIPPAPQPSRNQQTSDNKSANEGDDSSTDKLKPKIRKRHGPVGLSRKKLFAFFAEVVGILFLLACMLESHNIYALSSYFAALFLTYGMGCWFVFENLRRFKKVISLLIFVGLNVFTANIVYRNSRPVPVNLKPTAYFTFSLRSSNSPLIDLKLTNRFVLVRNFGVEELCNGRLFIPQVNGQSNFVLTLTVRNDSLVTAEHGELTIAFPKEWNFAGGSDWFPVENASASLSRTKEWTKTNSIQCWMNKLPDVVLSGNGILLSPITLIPDKLLPTAGMFLILARAANSPSCAVMFGVEFIPPHDNLRLRCPTLVEAVRDVNGNSIFPIPASQFEPIR